MFEAGQTIDNGHVSLSTQHTRCCTFIYERQTSYANEQISYEDITKGGRYPQHLASSQSRLLARNSKASVSHLQGQHDALSDLKIAVDTSIEHSSAQIADAFASEINTVPVMVCMQDHIPLAVRLTGFPGDLIVMIKQITECESNRRPNFKLLPLTSSGNN